MANKPIRCLGCQAVLLEDDSPEAILTGDGWLCAECCAELRDELAVWEREQ